MEGGGVESPFVRHGRTLYDAIYFVFKKHFFVCFVILYEARVEKERTCYN